jgi:hypothetical protein
LFLRINLYTPSVNDSYDTENTHHLCHIIMIFTSVLYNYMMFDYRKQKQSTMRNSCILRLDDSSPFVSHHKLSVKIVLLLIKESAIREKEKKHLRNPLKYTKTGRKKSLITTQH